MYLGFSDNVTLPHMHKCGTLQFYMKLLDDKRGIQFNNKV